MRGPMTDTTWQCVSEETHAMHNFGKTGRRRPNRRRIQKIGETKTTEKTAKRNKERSFCERQIRERRQTQKNRSSRISTQKMKKQT